MRTWLRYSLIYAVMRDPRKADPLESPPSCPTPHQLRAAQRVGQILSREPVALAQVREAYLRLPSDGVFGLKDYMVGEQLLRLAGIADVVDGRIRIAPTGVPPEVPSGPVPIDLLLSSYLDAVTPPWLGAATYSDRVWWDRIPAGEVAGLEAAFPDPEERERLLLQLARRFDDKVLKRLGEVGEEAVASEWRARLKANGRADLEKQVVRLSKTSDQLGYDLRAPALDESIRRVEVKITACQEPRVHVFISRNEAKTGICDEAWRLVICRRAPAGVDILGWLTGKEVRPRLPIDVENGRWDSAAVFIHERDIRPGLPL